jgi:hypothetical protein
MLPYNAPSVLFFHIEIGDWNKWKESRDRFQCMGMGHGVYWM